MVKYISGDNKGEETIILESSGLGYCTLEGAWYNHDIFEFINRATKESLAKALKALHDELDCGEGIDDR